MLFPVIHPPIHPPNKYYGYDASTHPEHLHNFGHVFNSAFSTQIKQEDGTFELTSGVEEPSTMQARLNRVRNFQQAANESIKVSPYDLVKHEIDKMPVKILGSLSVSSVEGLDLDQKNETIIKGAIEVSLVTCDDAQSPLLLFSINKGDIGLKVSEFFTYIRDCCCPSYSQADYGAMYEIVSKVTGQLVTVDMVDVVDFFAFKDVSRTLTAKAGDTSTLRGIGEKDKPETDVAMFPSFESTAKSKDPCCLGCSKVLATCCSPCNYLCSCRCCSCKAPPVTDRFTATDVFQLGTQPPINSSISFTMHSVDWNLQSSGRVKNMLVIYYKKKNETKISECKLTMSDSESFVNVQKFLMKLKAARNDCSISKGQTLTSTFQAPLHKEVYVEPVLGPAGNLNIQDGTCTWKNCCYCLGAASCVLLCLRKSIFSSTSM